jgi:plasmid stabilization system protein ParE
VPRVIITQGAVQGLERCRQFLVEKNPQAAVRAAQTISHVFSLIEQQPNAGKPLDESPELRELVIPFGDAGYVTLYRFEPADDTVYLLAFKHQKELGY